MNKFRLLLAISLLVALLGAASITARADTPADVLDTYQIQIAPQNDGSLAITIDLKNYCTNSDWPGDQPYLQIGVPNEKFTITDFGPKDGPHPIVKAEPILSGGSFAQLDFDPGSLPKNGDCFDLHVAVLQSQMAYPDSTNNQVTFKYIAPGWTFPIEVKNLTISWAKPTDESLIKVTEPSPTSTDGTNLIWTWPNPVMNSMNMFGDYAVKMAYQTTAFALSTDSQTSVNPDAAPAAPSGGGGGSGGPDGGTVLIIIIVVIVIILLLLFFIGMFGDSDGGGSYGGGGGIFSSGGGGGGGHSGGGGLGGGGGGFSCACAGCACACACAGGGKVGCSLKRIGIKVGCLVHVLKKEHKENEEG